jgi:hypothetical protein
MLARIAVWVLVLLALAALAVFLVYLGTHPGAYYGSGG